MATKKASKPGRRMRFEIARVADGYYWRMYGRNGKFLAAGHTTFRDSSAVKIIINTIKKHARSATIVVLP